MMASPTRPPLFPRKKFQRNARGLFSVRQVKVFANLDAFPFDGQKFFPNLNGKTLRDLVLAQGDRTPCSGKDGPDVP